MMRLFRILTVSLSGLIALAAGPGAAAQPMTLDEVIGVARTQSVPALEARAAFVTDYWAWRSYQASRLPSLALTGNLGNFDRSLRLLQDTKTGEVLKQSEKYGLYEALDFGKVWLEKELKK